MEKRQNLGLQIFEGRPSGENIAPHCPLKIMQRISKILKAILKERPNIPYFDAYSPTICNEEFFQKIHQAQTIFPIILYNHAKVREILSVAINKCKETPDSDGQDDRLMDMGQF